MLFIRNLDFYKKLICLLVFLMMMQQFAAEPVSREKRTLELRRKDCSKPVYLDNANRAIKYFMRHKKQPNIKVYKILEVIQSTNLLTTILFAVSSLLRPGVYVNCKVSYFEGRRCCDDWKIRCPNLS